MVKIAQRKFLQVSKNIAAYIEHDVLSHDFGDQRLCILRYVLNENAGEESGDNPLEALIVALGNMIVYGNLREPGTHLAGKGGEGNGDEGQSNAAFMWLEIGQQLAQQTRVKRAMLDLLFFVKLFAHSVSSSAASCCRACRSA